MGLLLIVGQNAVFEFVKRIPAQSCRVRLVGSVRRADTLTRTSVRGQWCCA